MEVTKPSYLPQASGVVSGGLAHFIVDCSRRAIERKSEQINGASQQSQRFVRLAESKTVRVHMNKEPARLGQFKGADDEPVLKRIAATEG